MKLIESNPLLLIGMLSMTLLAFSLPAAEQTGRVLEDLATRVDQQIGELESQAAERAQERERLKAETDVLLDKLETTPEGTAKANLRSDLAGVMARVNVLDRKEVAQTMGSVVGVLDTLRAMEANLRSGKGTPAEVEAQRRVMRQFAINTANVVKNLEKVSPDKTSGSLKNTIMMLHRYASDTRLGPGGAVGRVQSSINALEGVAMQLNIVGRILEDERDMLKTASQLQIVSLALSRLGDAKLGSDSVTKVAQLKFDEIGQRSDRILKHLIEDGSGGLGDDAEVDTLSFDELAALKAD
jgi:hypothetical protein